MSDRSEPRVIDRQDASRDLKSVKKSQKRDEGKLWNGMDGLVLVV